MSILDRVGSDKICHSRFAAQTRPFRIWKPVANVSIIIKQHTGARRGPPKRSQKRMAATPRVAAKVIKSQMQIGDRRVSSVPMTPESFRPPRQHSSFRIFFDESTRICSDTGQRLLVRRQNPALSSASENTIAHPRREWKSSQIEFPFPKNSVIESSMLRL